jgi:hypothetical protein
MAFTKTACAVTRDEFAEHAKPLDVQIDGIVLTAEVKQFSTGSLGWSISEKRDLRLNGKSIRVQVGLNVTIIGSKEAI